MSGQATLSASAYLVGILGCEVNVIRIAYDCLCLTCTHAHARVCGACVYVRTRIYTVTLYKIKYRFCTAIVPIYVATVHVDIYSKLLRLTDIVNWYSITQLQ